jgi:hypothetical protein
MAQWYEFGYFSDDLDIAFGENSMFLPLHQYKEINMKQNGVLPGTLPPPYGGGHFPPTFPGGDPYLQQPPRGGYE